MQGQYHIKQTHKNEDVYVHSIIACQQQWWVINGPRKLQLMHKKQCSTWIRISVSMVHCQWRMHLKKWCVWNISKFYMPIAFIWTKNHTNWTFILIITSKWSKLKDMKMFTTFSVPPVDILYYSITTPKILTPRTSQGSAWGLHTDLNRVKTHQISIANINYLIIDSRRRSIKVHCFVFYLQ